MIWSILPPKWSHALAPLGVKGFATWAQAQRAIYNDSSMYQWKSWTWRGLSFSNRLGIAGGVDKKGHLYPHWQKLGYGFCEVGTFTPLPQGPNPGKILDRQWSEQILWNKMGFPNAGIESLKKNFLANPPNFPVFVNVGKNRSTPIEKAFEDYKICISALGDSAQAFVINVSSPNTQGLRQLEDQKQLGSLVSSLRSLTKRPLLIKLSPDLGPKQLQASLQVVMTEGCDGAILTNTTLIRPANSPWPTEGGLSGRFLCDLSRKSLEHAVSVKNQNSDFLIVSVGGILTAEEVALRLRMGADLCQVYSALVFKGPWFSKEVAKYFRQHKTN